MKLRMPTERMESIGPHVHRAAWMVTAALGATESAVRANNEAFDADLRAPWHVDR